MSATEADHTAGWQTWSRLLFLHWKADPNQVQRLLPPGLEVEVFDGAAWVGLIPFQMQAVRPWWSPPVPGISWFLETNVRTYVRHESGLTGVWFFSLDANHRLAVWLARRFWHLNYIYSKLRVQNRSDGVYEYSGRRPASPQVFYDISAEISTETPTVASEGSLDAFLLERYRLFSRCADGVFFSGRVHHAPYRYQRVKVHEVRQTIMAANGLEVSSDVRPDHAVWSRGVRVRVSALQHLSAFEQNSATH